jgi:hypothetical protein
VNDPLKEPPWWYKVALKGGEVGYGTGLIRSGTHNYAAWSERMITKYGESVREKLSTIYSEAKTQAVAVDAMQRAEREMLGPSIWRPLEDAAWSCNRVRENPMLPVRAAYNDLIMWDAWRLKHAVETIDIRMVNRIFAEMEPLPEEVRNQCRSVVAERQVLEAAYTVESAAFEARKPPGKPGHSFWLKIEEAATEMSFAAIEASGGAIKAARSSAIVPDDAIGSP